MKLNFIFIFISYIQSAMIFTLKKNNTEYNEKLDQNLYLYLNKRLYVDISIGTPSQIIPTYINFEKPGFYFSNEENKLYNKLISSSYKQIEPNKSYGDEDFYYGNFSSENFKFKNDNNEELKVNNLNFILASNYRNLLQSRPGEIGLKLISHSSAFNSNFIYQLKKKKIIENYGFSLIFENKNEGILLIGKYPHEYNKKKFKEENLKLIHAEIRNDIPVWNTNFDNIYFGDNLIKDDIKTAYIKSELSGIMVGQQLFYNYTDTFFNQYTKNKKCEVNKKYSHYYFYICDDDIDIKKFPSIKFEHRVWNYTFELTYEDLFIKFGNKYYCLIAFYSLSTDIVYLGDVFLQKYTIVFDQDKKTMGFYHPNNNENNFNDRSSRNIFIFILIVIIVVLVYLYFKFLNNKKRKIRSNEIDDMYDYLAK